MNIRNAAQEDAEQIQNLHRLTFSENESVAIAELSIELLASSSKPETVTLVAESNNSIIGHVAFSPFFAKKDGRFLGYILAPLAVEPSQQKRGTGKKLVKTGMEILKDTGVSVFLVYGDPNYYSRFGFDEAKAKKFEPPFPLSYSTGWQAIAPVGCSGGLIDCLPALMKQALW